MTIVKICGARSARDVEVLARSGADLVGIWHGVPGGHAELSLREVFDLALLARRDGRAQPVLVTFLNDPAAVLRVTARTGVDWVQLHGYQPPAMVQALKAAAPHLTVVKVLHVQRGQCLERRFIGAYERAGTDYFLLDAVTSDGRVGSTGHRLSGAVVADLANLMTRPFLLAGGISDRNRPDYKDVIDHERFLGIDVDSAARDHEGELQPDRVTAIRRHWVAPDEDRSTDHEAIA